MTTEFRSITRADGSRKAAYRSVQTDGSWGPWHRTTSVDAAKSLRLAPTRSAIDIRQGKADWRSVQALAFSR
jgi:hypothetical protein